MQGQKVVDLVCRAGPCPRPLLVQTLQNALCELLSGLVEVQRRDFLRENAFQGLVATESNQNVTVREGVCRICSRGRKLVKLFVEMSKIFVAHTLERVQICFMLGFEILLTEKSDVLEQCEERSCS